MRVKKNYVYFFLSLLLVVIASCSSDDEPMINEAHHSKKELLQFAINFPTGELSVDSLDGEFKKDSESRAEVLDFTTIYLMNGSKQSIELPVNVDMASFRIFVDGGKIYAYNGKTKIPLTGNCYLATSPNGKVQAQVSPITTPNGKTTYSSFGDQIFISEKTFTFSYSVNKKTKKYEYTLTYNKKKYKNENGVFKKLKVELIRQSAKITTNVILFSSGFIGFVSYYRDDFERDTGTKFSDWSLRTFIKGAPNIYDQNSEKGEGYAITCITEMECPFMDGIKRYFSDGFLLASGIGYEFGETIGSHVFPMKAGNADLRISFYYKGTNKKYRPFNTLPIKLSDFLDGRHNLKELEKDTHYTLNVIIHKDDLISEMQQPTRSRAGEYEEDEFGPIMHIPYQVQLVANDKSQDE